jgi:N4-gp56 family major capsid protein
MAYTAPGGSAAGGQDAATTGTEPIIPSNVGTTAAGVAGEAYTNAKLLSGQFSKVVTSLVVRNVIDNLRKNTVLASEGSYIRARHIPGTMKMVFTGFADLTPAVNLLEGVPPESEKLQLDNFELTATQKGKVVAITDIAALASPFELYSVAAEKVAWNAITTLEDDIATLLGGAGAGLDLTPTGSGPVERLVEAVTTLKKAAVPTFADGMYHAFISPTDSAAVMTQTGELGWTDTMKYANTTALLNGEIGRLRGVRFIESHRIADGKTVVFGPEFMAWGDYQTIQAYRVAPGGDHADPIAQRGLVGWKGMWGLALVKFDGTPAMSVANPTGQRLVVVDLTA